MVSLKFPILIVLDKAEENAGFFWGGEMFEN